MNHFRSPCFRDLAYDIGHYNCIVRFNKGQRVGVCALVLGMGKLQRETMFLKILFQTGWITRSRPEGNTHTDPWKSDTSDGIR